MRHFLCVFILFIHVIFIQSQDITNKETISWDEASMVKKDFDINNNNIYYLYFNGAVYKSLNTRLPYFTDIVKLNSNNISDVSVSISDMQFQTLDTKYLRNIQHLDSIPKKIILQHEIVYIKKQPFLQYSFIPLKKTGKRIEKLTDFRIKITPALQIKTALKKKKSYKSNSVLRSGSWYKIKISTDGIYKLTWSDIDNMGIDNTQNVKIYGNKGGMLPFSNSEKHIDDLVEIPVYMDKGSDGIFNKGDYLLFYGDGPVSWSYIDDDELFMQDLHSYSTASYYFITSKSGNNRSPSNALSISQSATHTVNSFNDFAYHEVEQENMIKSGRKFFEKMGTMGSISFSFNFPNLLSSSSLEISSKVLARSTNSSTFYIKVNDQITQTLNLWPVSMDGYLYADVSSMKTDFTASSDKIDVDVVFNHNNNPSAEAWLDYVTINARRELRLNSDQLLFRDKKSAGPGNIASFTLKSANNNTIVWDITDPVNIKKISTNLSGSNLSFKVHTDSIREFIAFDKTGDFLTPVYKDDDDIGLIENQNLHNAGQPDMVIVSHADFLEQAEDLKTIHEEEGLDVLVTTPGKIYNEFSSGAPDVSAIRNLMKMLYDRASGNDELPRYLLLFGDGSYDNISSDNNNTNFIPTYQIENSINTSASYVTDDFFGLLDDDEGGTKGAVDIGVGRFPVKTVEEARGIIEKIENYTSKGSYGDWRNSLVFVGDDEDANTHMNDANKLANYINTEHPGFSITKIFLDAYPQVSTPVGQRYPDVNEQINNQIFKGALIFNYSGHGSETGLAHERIVTTSDIQSWENIDKLPLFVTATCEFSRFDDYERTAAGEMVILNDKGGGIALLTTTRVVYSGSNYTLNREFYNHVFKKDNNNERYRLGDIIRMTKNNAGSTDNKRKFILLGDPALKLNYPFYKVNTTAINNTNINKPLDTLRALTKVSVKGEVVDNSNQLIDNFNGIVYPVVFDKTQSIETLANDDDPPFNFEARNSVIYKGKASVTKGKFDFSFIIPKDIIYSYGFGKIGYYADNNNIDANGSFKNFIIGGSADSIPTDNSGPDIRLFMNDTNFASGGITDNNPKILALLYDENGINTTGNGIGHDISAVLDNDKTYVLNDYYEADLDSYQGGSVEYPLSDLEKGDHRLKIKVWDVYNNSSDEFIDFVVVSDKGMILDHVLNYPNPFTTNTSFFFEHNQPGSTLDVLIQVFTVSGKLVKTIRRTIVSNGYRVEPIEWDGRDDFGSNIGRGVYIYRVKVRNENGKTAEKYQKLVILK